MVVSVGSDKPINCLCAMLTKGNRRVFRRRAQHYVESFTYRVRKDTSHSRRQGVVGFIHTGYRVDKSLQNF